MKPSRSVNKSALSTTVAVILTAIIVGSVVGGATSYLFMSRTDSMTQELRADVRAVADAAGVPINNPDELKKLMDERKLIEAAKQEGKLVVYSVQDPRTFSALRSAFERIYPSITVEFVSAAGGTLTDRFVGEFDKGVKSADVLATNQVQFDSVFLKRDNLLAKYVPKDSGWLTADQKDRDGRAVAYTVVLGVTAYNTKLVSKAELPKSLRDLVDSKWDGKRGGSDPKPVPAAIDFLRSYEKEYGESWMKQFTAQKVRYYASANDLNDAVAKGEVSIATTVVSFVEARKLAGQPVDWVRASDNAYFVNYALLGIPSNAPHPNAAKLWVDFVISKEGQQILADSGTLPVMSGLRLSNPDMAIQGKKLITVQTLSDAERKAFLDKYPGLAP